MARERKQIRLDKTAIRVHIQAIDLVELCYRASTGASDDLPLQIDLASPAAVVGRAKTTRPMKGYRHVYRYR
jgi:hypothetical protein